MCVIGENLLRPEPTLLERDESVAEAIDRGELPEDIARAFPASPLAWALAAEDAYSEGRALEAYAFARVGYHRGLDSLRRGGWKGQGPVPWSHEPNRGVLLAFYALRRSAHQIGEMNEVDRLTDLLRDSDPDAIAQIEASA